MPLMVTQSHSQGNDMYLHLKVNCGPLQGGDDAEAHTFSSVATDMGQQLPAEGRAEMFIIL